jgi:hypothetical protein
MLHYLTLIFICSIGDWGLFLKTREQPHVWFFAVLLSVKLWIKSWTNEYKKNLLLSVDWYKNSM